MAVNVWTGRTDPGQGGRYGSSASAAAKAKAESEARRKRAERRDGATPAAPLVDGWASAGAPAPAAPPAPSIEEAIRAAQEQIAGTMRWNPTPGYETPKGIDVEALAAGFPGFTDQSLWGLGDTDRQAVQDALAARTFGGGSPAPAPAAEVFTPAAEVFTPAAEVFTPAAEVFTPAAETFTPAAEVVTPAAEVVTPAAAVATPAAAAAPAPTTQETAADAIDNVQVTLGKQNKAIQGALQSGLIDISTAAEMWDTQRKQIYKDFVDQYGGAGDQYATEDERIAGQRSAERSKILADLDMRGVDASMVGEELSILDALVGSQTNANVDYMSEQGDIAAMADQDRQWLGEGIFGGYEQDLRSQMRNLGLGLEIDSATAEGERLDQALSSNALSEFLGVPASTLMGGMVGGVDIPGMSFQTSEREAGQDFASAEALLGRDWQGGENALNRGFATDERLAGQSFTSGENALGRDLQQDAFAEQQRQFNQGVRSDAAADIRGVREREEDVAYRDAMLAATMGADESQATIDAAAVKQGQENWQSQFDAGMMGVDTREYIPGPETGAGGQNVMIRNPTYGMTPTQALQATIDLVASTQPDETEIDTFSNLMMILSEGSLFNPEMATDVLTQIGLKIDESTGMATKGMTGNNVLFALGQLANEPGEKDNAGNVTYPYRELFYQVQRLNQGTTPGGTVDTGVTTGIAGGGVNTGDLGSTGFSTGAGNLSASEMENQDLVDLIAGGQAGYGPGFEYGTGVSGAIGDAGAAAGKGVWGAMQGDSYTSPSGIQYGGTSLDNIANSAIPPGYTVQEWIVHMEERGKKWGLKSDGRFGWE